MKSRAKFPYMDASNKSPTESKQNIYKTWKQ